MKFLVVLAVAVACASADVSHIVPKSVDFDAPILKYENENTPEGNFAFSYETGNGISAAAEGVVTNTNSENPTLSVRGGFKYTSPDGTPVETSYTADENGFVASGSHIPVAPPVPEYILRALKFIADNPPPPSVSTIYNKA